MDFHDVLSLLLLYGVWLGWCVCLCVLPCVVVTCVGGSLGRQNEVVVSKLEVLSAAAGGAVSTGL